MKIYLVQGFLILISITLIYVAIRILLIRKKIKKTGIEVEGVIFDTELFSNPGASSISFPIVRFVTEDKLWITKASGIGVIPGTYKKGKKIKIVYEKALPENFYIKDWMTDSIPVIMIIGGAFLIGFAIFQLINIKP
jgi:hypothetical protein